jgi:hypothetical protein
LYQSRELANEARQFGANEILAAIFVTALMHQPLFFFPTFGVFYYVYGRVKIVLEIMKLIGCFF